MEMLIERTDEKKRVIDPKNWRDLEMGKVYKVPKNQYWLRRLESGDVKEFDASKLPKKAEKKVEKVVETKKKFKKNKKEKVFEN